MIRIIGFLWSLPLTLVGLLFVPFCGPLRWSWRDGCIEVIVKRWIPGYVAFTCGHTVLFLNGYYTDSIRRHELSHVRDCDIWGVFLVPAYGIASLISRLRGTGWYRGNWFEARARAYAAS